MAFAASGASTLRRHLVVRPPRRCLLSSTCSSEEASKPWRLSSSVVILAPSESVPDCALSAGAAGARQDYRICFVKRAARSSFMPDAMVFPGGAVDVEDLSSSVSLCGSGSTDMDGAIRCAAVREVFEESGIGIFKPEVKAGKEHIAEWRKRVHDSASDFRSFCKEFGTSPACEDLHYWCSFITPDMEHERLKKGGFDARFFVWCAHGENSQLSHALADSQETVSLVWLTPDEALQAAYDGKIAMAPPQWYITKELAEACPRLADVPAHATSKARMLQRDYPIKPYPVGLPKAEQAAFLGRHESVGDTKPPPVMALVYPGDGSHPVFPGPAAARHRMLMVGALGGKMKYELQLDDSARGALPLQEAKQGWYSLAKL